METALNNTFLLLLELNAVCFGGLWASDIQLYEFHCLLCTLHILLFLIFLFSGYKYQYSNISQLVSFCVLSNLFIFLWSFHYLYTHIAHNMRSLCERTSLLWVIPYVKLCLETYICLQNLLLYLILGLNDITDFCFQITLKTLFFFIANCLLILIK